MQTMANAPVYESLSFFAVARALHVARLRIYNVHKAFIVDTARYRKQNKHYADRLEERVSREHTVHCT